MGINKYKSFLNVLCLLSLICFAALISSPFAYAQVVGFAPPNTSSLSSFPTFSAPATSSYSFGSPTGFGYNPGSFGFGSTMNYAAPASGFGYNPGSFGSGSYMNYAAPTSYNTGSFGSGSYMNYSAPASGFGYNPGSFGSGSYMNYAVPASGFSYNTGSFGSGSPMNYAVPTSYNTGSFGSGLPMNYAASATGFGLNSPTGFGVPATGFGYGSPTGYGVPATGFGYGSPTGYGVPATGFGYGSAMGFGAPLGGLGFGSPVGFGAPIGGLGLGLPMGMGFGAPLGGLGFGLPMGYGVSPYGYQPTSGSSSSSQSNTTPEYDSGFYTKDELPNIKGHWSGRWEAFETDNEGVVTDPNGKIINKMEGELAFYIKSQKSSGGKVSGTIEIKDWNVAEYPGWDGETETIEIVGWLDETNAWLNAHYFYFTGKELKSNYSNLIGDFLWNFHNIEINASEKGIYGQFRVRGTINTSKGRKDYELIGKFQVGKFVPET